jgi:hypothetical protein
MNASTNRTRGFLPPGCRGYPITKRTCRKPDLRAVHFRNARQRYPDSFVNTGRLRRSKARTRLLRNAPGLKLTCYAAIHLTGAWVVMPIRWKARAIGLLVLVAITRGDLVAQSTSVPTMTLPVDETQLFRRIAFVHEQILVQQGPLALAYPRWIPGEHD